MKNHGRLIIVVAFLFFLIFSPTIGTAQPTCAELATILAGNPLLTPLSYPLPTSTLVPATGVDAAYCNVQITYSSRGGPEYGYAVGQVQHIGIGIGLPLNSSDGGKGGVQGAWNGKLQNLGGGVCAGIVGPTTSATDAGYVGTSTDTGHTLAEIGARCNFGVIQSIHKLDLGMIDDFIYEGVHQQVEWGKALANIYYGMAPIRNYWNGCSTGGRQGLALAQKWGDQFDGFIVGAPAIYWQEFRLSDSWPYLVVKDRLTAIGKSLTDAQFAAANAAAIAACENVVLADGIIDNPLECHFSATANICGKPGAPASPNCLDADQAAAIDLIWAGPHNHYGLRIWYPFERGVLLSNFLIDLFPNFSTNQVLAYDHLDLNYPVNNLYLDEAAIAAAGYPPNAITYEDEATLSARVTDNYMETQDVNLDKVKHRGGKIIMWQGSADPLIRWRDSVDYYRRVATYYGHGEADYEGLQPWFRYYHAPGASHCGPGVGPAPANVFGNLVDWVEKGIAPDTILATGGSFNPTATRPLCPWPKTAIYNGSGPTTVASSFHCGGNMEPPSVVCEMLRTVFGFENGRVLDFAETDGWVCPKWDGWPLGQQLGQ